MRRGNEEVCVLEIVRPGMEDSESAKKQENTGIGPASAPNRAMSTEVVTSSSCAGLTRASIFFARSLYEEGWIAGSSPAMTARGVVTAKAGTHDLRRWLWIPALAALGRDDDYLARAEPQPADVRNRDWGNFHCFGLILTMKIATPTCSAAETEMCRPKCVTPYVTHDVPPSVRRVTIRRHPHMSPSVVIMCFGFEAPMPTRRIHITPSNPPPGPRPR